MSLTLAPFSSARATQPERPIAPEWPAPIDEAAFYGVFGDLVKLVEPHTESDPAALLIQLLVMFGNIVGQRPHFVAEGSRHRLVLYAVLVGLTSKGRKGSSFNTIKAPLRALDDRLDDPTRVVSGLSSGEGLIYAVRDPVLDGDDLADPGIVDKRLLVVESEFARVLKAQAREGNILSAVIRENWDSGDLGTLTKSNRTKATNAHVSIIGHITKDELHRYLTATETGNGFGNRFLWVCTKRSKLLPEGGALHTVDFGPVVHRLAAAVDHAHQDFELRRDPDARALWAEVYPKLSEGAPGMFGAMTSRGEAQVMRLACLYAVGDMSYVVGVVHLKAALAIWSYCENSARFLFGASLGDPVADELDAALQGAGVEGLTRTEIRDYFGRNRGSADVSRALMLLLEHGRIQRYVEPNPNGRPTEHWYHLSFTT